MSLFGVLDESRSRVEPVLDLVHGTVPCISEASVEEVVPVAELGLDESFSEGEGVEGRACILSRGKVIIELCSMYISIVFFYFHMLLRFWERG